MGQEDMESYNQPHPEETGHIKEEKKKTKPISVINSGQVIFLKNTFH